MINTSMRQWDRLTSEAKRAFANGDDMVAKRYFQLAEQEAMQISPTDVRRGVSLSWLAMLYFKAANYQLADEMFLEAEHIYTTAEPSQLKTEILTNFVKLGMYASSKGTSIKALDYCQQDKTASTPISFFRTSQLRLCEAKDWSLAQRRTVAKQLSAKRLTDANNLRQRSVSKPNGQAGTPVWNKLMDKLQQFSSPQKTADEAGDAL